MDIVKDRILKVFACRECNCLLSNSWQESLSERKRELKRRLRKRYKYLLEMPDWDEDELEVMGYMLKSNIESNLLKRDLVKSRLSW